jgi:hypothetical protein
MGKGDPMGVLTDATEKVKKALGQFCQEHNFPLPGVEIYDAEQMEDKVIELGMPSSVYSFYSHPDSKIVSREPILTGEILRQLYFHIQATKVGWEQFERISSTERRRGARDFAKRWKSNWETIYRSVGRELRWIGEWTPKHDGMKSRLIAYAIDHGVKFDPSRSIDSYVGRFLQSGHCAIYREKTVCPCELADSCGLFVKTK